MQALISGSEGKAIILLEDGGTIPEGLATGLKLIPLKTCPHCGGLGYVEKKEEKP